MCNVEDRYSGADFSSIPIKRKIFRFSCFSRKFSVSSIDLKGFSFRLMVFPLYFENLPHFMDLACGHSATRCKKIVEVDKWWGDLLQRKNCGGQLSFGHLIVHTSDNTADTVVRPGLHRMHCSAFVPRMTPNSGVL